MPAATPAPSQHPAPHLKDTWPADGPWLTEASVDEDPERIAAWLDRELARAAPWLDNDPWLDDYHGLDGPPEPAAPPVEVFKAGRWDRSDGDGGGFAAGGLADHLPPGPVLAGLAGDRWTDGLERLSDDQLIGVLRAARRLASWAAAMEIDATRDVLRRRIAEEDAGDAGAALHADAEIAAALTLTTWAAGKLLGLAAALDRLPATRAALAAGEVNVPRATVIADELTGLTDAHAAAVEQAIIVNAPGQTTGELRRAVRRAVLTADPTAARKRKEEALREARVERWTEPAGTAALAGRDLPPAEVLAADANLTALARQLKAAGVAGTLDMLRAKIYLALLTGTPVTGLLPANTDRSSSPDAARCGSHDAGGGAPDNPPSAATGPGAAGASPSGLLGLGGASITGRVNLTLPLATWLGQSDVPGQVPGYGPLDAMDSRALTAALATHPGTQWCLTLTGPGGRPVAHGCAGSSPGRGRARSGAGPRDKPTAAARDRPHATPRAGPAARPGAQPAAGPPDQPAAGPPDQPAAGPPDQPATGPPDQPAAGPPDQPAAGPPDQPAAGPPDQPAAGPPDQPAAGPSDQPAAQAHYGQWTFTLTPLDSGGCDHAWETPAYRPTAALRHLVNLRHAVCVFPGCARPAAQCDADHTIAYEDGGKTCLCNLAPLCRHHHQVKQAPGWALEQSSPGTMTWATPSGRRYTTPSGA